MDVGDLGGLSVPDVREKTEKSYFR